MNDNIIKSMSTTLSIKETQIKAVLTLLADGSTIPFIARYRKEMTGNLDEEQIRAISEVYEYQQSLLKRKEDILRLIDEKDLLTDEIRLAISQAVKLVELEDIYRPYKEKKKTKATEAVKNGLEPLAKAILTLPTEGSLESMAKAYLNDQVKSVEEALQGASYIIAEYISDNATYRSYIRRQTYFNGLINTKVKKTHSDEKKTYELYYHFSSKTNMIKPHQVLAINRAENEKVITVSLDIDTSIIMGYLNSQINQRESIAKEFINGAIIDGYKRLIAPSIERDIRSELKEVAEEQAIKVFGDNLEKLLLTPPIKNKVVLGFDPAFRTGCKLAVIDAMGNVLSISVIYPHEPKNEVEKSKQAILTLIDKYKVDIIAIGNGTASRESETFIANVIKEATHPVVYAIVSEAGASVYSASKLAIEEFPNLHVEERSAISIGRRIQDALSELVKIDPKSIGVGQYQHDVNQKKLNESLGFTVTKVVNNVGININNSSKTILSYVSGMNKTYIDKLAKLLEAGKRFNSREDIAKVISPKVYEQAIGFIRIMDGTNILDKTDIHPESYATVNKLLKALNLEISNIDTPEFKQAIEQINITELTGKLDVDKYTLTDIKASLLKPGRDPRESYDTPILKSDILTIDDLKVGMKLFGTVRNVIDFGAFVDIGLKNDGLVHISKLSNSFVKHPSEVLSVGEIVEVTVIEIDLDKKKVALSLI